jgi:uncharacterized membrane protein YhhN
LLWILITGIVVIDLVLAELHQERGLVKVFKPLASTCFLIVAVDTGAFRTVAGSIIFGGLVFSWLGDVFLISKERRWFFAGLLSFLLAHVAYIAGFIARGIDLTYFFAVLPGLLVASALVFRWIKPKLDGLEKPVVLYMAIISTMVAAAVGNVGSLAGPGLVLGASLFYLSDVCVARERFVKSEFMNKAIGLPTYYAGQVLIALCGAL